MSLLGKGSWYNPLGFLGKAGDLKKFAGTKEGSLMSGRAILQGGPKEQNMESARTIDVFGSPATAGTKMQTTARLGAILYGLGAGAAAYGTGAAGSGGGVGFGGTTSASAAPSATASGFSPFTTQMGYSGGTVGSGAGATTGAASNWQNYARAGNSMMQQGQQSAPQQGALQHQYVGQQQQPNPYLMRGYPWS